MFSVEISIWIRRLTKDHPRQSRWDIIQPVEGLHGMERQGKGEFALWAEAPIFSCPQTSTSGSQVLELVLGLTPLALPQSWTRTIPPAFLGLQLADSDHRTSKPSLSCEPVPHNESVSLFISHWLCFSGEPWPEARELEKPKISSSVRKRNPSTLIFPWAIFQSKDPKQT